MELDKEKQPRILDLNAKEPAATGPKNLRPAVRDLLAKYPAIRLLSSDDNRQVLEFFEKSSMSGESLKLRYERSPDFFKFLRYRAPVNLVFGGTNRAGALTGVAAYSFSRAYINEREETVCYLGDLRAELNRDTASSWRDLYGEMLLKARQLPGLNGCRYFFTAIIDDNQAARRTLVAKPRNPFVYHELCKYKMVNVVRRKPWSRVTPSRTRRAGPRDFDRLSEFLDRESRRRQFGPGFISELPRRLAEWHGLNLSSFLIHENASGEIDACVAPWSPAPAKRIIVEEMPPSIRAFRAAMGLFGRRVPGPGEELEISYLTHFQISRDLDAQARGAIFEELVASAYQERPGILGYCDFENDSFLDRLSSYFVQSVPMTLYQVIHASEAPELGLTASPGFAPGFEMALV